LWGTLTGPPTRSGCRGGIGTSVGADILSTCVSDVEVAWAGIGIAVMSATKGRGGVLPACGAATCVSESILTTTAVADAASAEGAGFVAGDAVLATAVTCPAAGTVLCTEPLASLPLAASFPPLPCNKTAPPAATRASSAAPAANI
jgi:hypothetical protein